MLKSKVKYDHFSPLTLDEEFSIEIPSSFLLLGFADTIWNFKSRLLLSIYCFK